MVLLCSEYNLFLAGSSKKMLISLGALRILTEFDDIVAKFYIDFMV